MKITCDIDGVLADVREYVKVHLIGKGDWKAYFSYTREFPVIEPMLELIRILRVSNDVYLVTGRPQSNRALTEAWLSCNLSPNIPMDKLLMRPKGDSRSPCDIKMEWFRELQPHLIIDDDPAVIEAATKEGFVVLQVHGFRCTKNDYTPFEGAVGR